MDEVDEREKRVEEFDYLIVGGGLTAASAVEGIRSREGEGRIIILGDEEEPPYHRPPLSKEYLQTPEAGRDLLHVKPETWYGAEAAVTLRLKERVIALDPREMTVTCAGGEEYRGGRILLATGGRPRTLAVPGADLERVFTFRTVEDAEALRAAAQEAEEAVLVGSGFIGMELAASLRKYGVRPTVVEVADRVWPSMLPAELSAFVQGYFEEHLVAFRLEAKVREFQGDGAVESAALESGEELPCQLAAIGIGILPNAELAARAGLAVKDGIIVDRYGETSHGYIYAAGDVARFPDPVFEESTRVEHWDHAKAHGRLVGCNMAGDREAYDHLSYFFTDVFELGVNVFGHPEEADRIIVRGELGAGRSIVLCGSEDRLCATILVNANDAMKRCRELVRRRLPLEEVEEALENPDVELEELVR